jgi:signal transduction histidine kinase
LYVYLFAVLTSQPRQERAARLLLALVSSSGLWYLGRLVMFYLGLASGPQLAGVAAVVDFLANAGGWLAWPIGIALAWYSWWQHERRFWAALMLAGTVSGIASGVWPLGSFPTVLGTLPAPLVIVWFLYREQIFGLLLPRRALLAAALGGSAALYLVLTPLGAEGLRQWLGLLPEVTRVALVAAGAIIFLPLSNLILEREDRRQRRRTDAVREMMREVSRILDVNERAELAARRTREIFGFRGAQVIVGDGPPRDGWTHRWPLESEGRTLGVLAVDAAPRRRLEDDEPLLASLALELGHSLDTLRLVEEKLHLQQQLLRQEHLASLGKVSAAVAHEIKNPLSSIRTIAQVMLEDPEVAERYGRDLGYILSESARLAASVEQLLGFSRPVEAVATPVDVSALVSSVAERVRAQCQVEPGWWLPRGNPELVSQIAWNLMSNAEQASPGQVRVELDGRGEDVELRVSDAGPGIPAELQARVFEPFYTTKQKGTGLGLAVVKKAVQNLRGEIAVESPLAEGRGTRLVVRLPGAERRG